MSRNITKAALLAVCAAILAHIVFSFLLAAIASRTFDVRGPNLRFYNFASSANTGTIRIVNPQFSITNVARLSVAYLQDRWAGIPVERRILFIGSSVTWGYPMQARSSLSGAFERAMPDMIAANVAVIGGNLTMNITLACSIGRAGVRAQIAFVELPVMNELPRVIAGQSSASTAADCPHLNLPLTGTSYTTYFLSAPFGISMLARTRETNPDRGGDVTIRSTNIPQTYRYSREDVLDNAIYIQESVAETLRVTSEVAELTVLFVSPMLLAAFEEHDVDARFIEDFVEIAMNECRRYDSVICLEAGDEFASQREYYYNVTHLNRVGTIALIDSLLEGIGY